RHEAIVVDSELVKAVAPDALGRSHFHRDEPRAACRARGKISDRAFGDIAFAVGEARRHRGHDDPIGYFDRAYIPRGEERGHGAAARVSRGEIASMKRR